MPGRAGPPDETILVAPTPGDAVLLDSETDVHRVPLAGIRRVIADHMSEAHRQIPPVTFVDECDFEGVDRRQVVAILLKAIVNVLPRFPEMNAQLDGEEIVYFNRYDFGVAVSTDRGLMVPVVRRCGQLTVDEIAAEITRLATLARSGRIAPGDLRGSTLTVTSPGKAGGLFATPIINHPQSTIIGIYRIADRPVVRDHKIVIRAMGNISVTFDHRIVDGARAAGFCAAIIEQIAG